MKNIHLQNASAGSGKTYTLAKDVTKKVVEGLEPEQLIVTTFTKKAAAELRGRLRQRLIEEGKIAEAHRVNDGHIGTVNSVSARIMKEYAIDSGASPALDVLPEEDEARIFGIAIADAISAHAGKIEAIADRFSRAEEYAAFGKPRNWQNDVRDIVDAARSNRMTAEDVRNCAEKSWAGVRVLFAGAENGRDDKMMFSAALKFAVNELDGCELKADIAEETFKKLKHMARDVERTGEVAWSKWISIINKKLPVEIREPAAGLVEVAGHALLQGQLYKDIKELINVVFDCAADAIEQYENYKFEHGLMDFADQDAGVLDLLEGNKEVGQLFSERIQEVFVDEFQDTNPIQLALFIEFSKLLRRSLWVGDPKQAIYGFRGTDSKLMQAATRAIPSENIESTLDKSYRSKKELIAFTNAIFRRVFHNMNEKDVCLTVAEDAKKDTSGGWIETWNIPGATQKYNRGVAGAVIDLLSRKEGQYKPGQIAVLCRYNASCELIAKSLEGMGVRATAEQGNVMNTPECQLAVAALKYMNDEYDSLALTEIISLSPFHTSHKDWLSEILKRSSNPDTYEARFEEWEHDSIIQALAEKRENMKRFDLMQALETAIEKVRLVETIGIWTKSEQRFGNLDKLRAACGEYLEYCRVQRSAATVTGFLSHLKDAETKQAQGVGEDAVQVLTYHKAKGLQWPVVVLADMGAETKFDAFGIAVEAESDFDAAQPLRDRYIRYWPWPFGAIKKVPGLDSEKEATPEFKRDRDEAKEEAKRLMYVGMTRAEEGMVLAVKSKYGKMETGWLDELVDVNGAAVLKLPTEAGEQKLAIGEDAIPVTTYNYDPETFGDKTNLRAFCYTPPLADPQKYLAAKIIASKIDDKNLIKRAKVKPTLAMKTRLVASGTYEPNDFGDAVHAYLGIDVNGKTIDEKLDIARRCLENWGVSKNAKHDALVAVGEELAKFIEDKYPSAYIMCEWPVAYRNELGQLMEGYIDMLVETPDGYVIIDHKVTSPSNAEEKAKKYAPQLFSYKEAVEKATGKKALATLAHMPVVGKVFELT